MVERSRLETQTAQGDSVQEGERLAVRAREASV